MAHMRAGGKALPARSSLRGAEGDAAIHLNGSRPKMDCRVASLLAMTIERDLHSVNQVDSDPLNPRCLTPLNCESSGFS